MCLCGNTKGLVTTYREGGLQNMRGGKRSFTLAKRGGAEKVLDMLKGCHKKF